MSRKAQQALFQVENIRLVEQIAIKDLATSEDELMTRAGVSVFKVLKKYYPAVRKLTVFCGCGNNAGDGYILAKAALDNGYYVVAHQLKEIKDLPPPAYRAAKAALAAGLILQDLEEPIDADTELIIDALLGIGIKGEVKGILASTISQINQSDLPILSIDVPSGLNADFGTIMGVCVRANITVTFIAQKIGMFIVDGPDYSGKIICASLELDNCLNNINPYAYLLDENYSYGRLPKRLKNSHKSQFGHVLIIGGGIGMPGAPYLAANAALRVGAGMVTIATNRIYAKQVLPLLPEVMIYGIDKAAELLHLLAKATVCVLGPGLGEDEWANSLFVEAIGAAELPMIIDASALRILAKEQQHDDNWILTPHPGEAASLLNCSIEEVPRPKAIALIQEQYGGNIVLKGHGTLIKVPEDPLLYVCGAGNPGMATAGMGDVLSGVIAGFVAQGLSLANATKLGVWVHSNAADLAVASCGELGLIASDLMPHLRKQANLYS